MTKLLKEIQEVTLSAKMLAENYSDMTAQSIYNEHLALRAEFEAAKLKAIRGGYASKNKLLSAIVECMKAIDEAEDGLELKHNQISTNL